MRDVYTTLGVKEEEANSKQIVLGPFKYIESLPSKGVRNILIDALGVWFKVPEESQLVIRGIVALLHTSSLMCANRVL